MLAVCLSPLLDDFDPIIIMFRVPLLVVRDVLCRCTLSHLLRSLECVDTPKTGSLLACLVLEVAALLISVSWSSYF